MAAQIAPDGPARIETDQGDGNEPVRLAATTQREDDVASVSNVSNKTSNSIKEKDGNHDIK